MVPILFQNHFRSLSKTKVKKSLRRRNNKVEDEGSAKTNAASNNSESVASSSSSSVAGGSTAMKMIKRHAGVLGLCACVSASPYDVPDYMPEILMTLSEHVEDPQPIQVK